LCPEEIASVREPDLRLLLEDITYVFQYFLTVNISRDYLSLLPVDTRSVLNDNCDYKQVLWI
jgi:hypothetical protein